MGTAVPPEMHARRYDLGIVEYHKRTFREKSGEFAEHGFAGNSVLIDEKFRCIPLRQRVFGYSVLCKRIIVIFNSDIRYHGANIVNNSVFVRSAKNAAKYCIKL